MYNLINNNFNRTYNPSGRQNALSDIKRMLTSRDTAAQNKACGYLIEVVNRYNKNSEEGARMVEYLISNDITVFLCEATSNLDFSLFRSIVTCLRILWRSSRFFSEEHAAHSMTAVLRSLAHYAGSGPTAAVDACLHYICDLLTGISTHETTSALCYQSAYSATQLLSCLNTLITQVNTNPNIVLSSALVLDSLISYQPSDLTIKCETASSLVEIVVKWFDLLMGALNHSVLVGENSGMFYVVACQLGIDALRLTKLLNNGEQKPNLVQSIVTDEHEINILKQSALDMSKGVQKIIADLVSFTKDHQTDISSEEYRVFLKFLLYFFYESAHSDALTNFCDMLFAMGYLSMLPQAQIMRKDASIRKASTLVLKELLKVLADKYLNVHNTDNASANDIQMGLVELQYGIEKPQSIGMQLQKEQPYSLLIYIYFYCQSTDNPEEATSPLLPYLVDHILKMPKTFKPPPHIIKALWLVFAMSTLSNGSLQSLDERVHLEKATDRLLIMLYPDPSIYYTHNPAILLWAFTSLRISDHVKFHVLSQWLKNEDSLPLDLTTKPTVWSLILNIIVQCIDKTIVENCMRALHLCMDEGDDDSRNNFACFVWSMLPNYLSKALIDCDNRMETNMCYLLDIATTLLPLELDQTICLKTAVLITAIFTKNNLDNFEKSENRSHYDCVCLKLCLYLLGLANDQNDNRVLLTFINRAGFLSSVLYATNSIDDTLACAALQLLSYIVHYFTKNNYQPKSVLQIQTQLVIQSLRRDSYSERGAALLQFVYTVLNCTNSPIALAYDIEPTPLLEQQCNALRALMFRVQLMMCCRESKTQSSAGWKTLSSIFKHAIMSKNDSKLVASLTAQPWTHVLVQFQLTQHITAEFLSFLYNWLTLLNITVRNSKENMKMNMSKHSLVVKTMVLLKNLIAENDSKDMIQKILIVVNEILNNSGVKMLD